MASPVVANSFRRTMAQLPTSVAVIAADSPDGPVGCTANAVLSLSLSPSSMLVSLSTGSRTLDRILAAGTFSVNGLSWHQRELCARFAIGDPLERFDGVAHEIQRGAPVLPDSVVSVVCRVVQVIPVHDHTLLVGDVLWSRSTEDTALVLHRGRQHAAG
jgi:flavin reductase (DIM6/NTAB) family NADH-FMN oxidoreductase RutF